MMWNIDDRPELTESPESSLLVHHRIRVASRWLGIAIEDVLNNEMKCNGIDRHHVLTLTELGMGILGRDDNDYAI